MTWRSFCSQCTYHTLIATEVCSYKEGCEQINIVGSGEVKPRSDLQVQKTNTLRGGLRTLGLRTELPEDRIKKPLSQWFDSYWRTLCANYDKTMTTFHIVTKMVEHRARASALLAKHPNDLIVSLTMQSWRHPGSDVKSVTNLRLGIYRGRIWLQMTQSHRYGNIVKTCKR